MNKRKPAAYTLHTAAALSLAAGYVVAAFAVSGALPAAAILSSEAAVVLVSGEDLRGLGRWARSMRPVLVVALTVFLLNALMGPGSSEIVSWRLPLVTVRVTAEAVLYGIAMALRLFAVVGAFSLLGMTSDEDELLFLLTSPLSKSSLAMALTLRLAPYIGRRVAAVHDAQVGRGVIMSRGPVAKRLKASAPVLRAAVHESLELSLNLAEAMFARGWGAGPRSRYPLPRLRLRDFAVCASSLAALALVIVTGGAAGPLLAVATALPPATYAGLRVVVGCSR